MAANKANLKARRFGCTGKLTAADVLAVLHAAATCEVCGTSKDLQLDHKLPLSISGDNLPHNIRSLCFTCNGKEYWRVRRAAAAAAAT